MEGKTTRVDAVETVLVHREIAGDFLPRLKERLADGRAEHPVELRLDSAAAAIIPGTPAGERDFDTEFLDYILAVKVVDSLEEAVAHIAAHSTGHSESIVTGDGGAESFWRRWTPPPSTGTPLPALPTEGSSAWAVRWAFPPRSSMPGGRWASRSCAPLSILSGEAGRCADTAHGPLQTAQTFPADGVSRPGLQ